nr:DUF1700 domain-containing protein [Aneurinibacillus sp. XH2]
MSKEDFFRDLEYKLKGLPEQERRQILQVYEDLFRTAAENGKDEREVTAYLGFASDHPPLDHLAVYPHPAIDSSHQGIRPLIASVALGLFNLIIVLPPFLAISALLLAFCIMTFVLLALPLFIWWFPYGDILFIHKLFLTMAVFGLGMLTGIASWYSVKWYFIAVRKYIQINVNLIKGE